MHDNDLRTLRHALRLLQLMQVGSIPASPEHLKEIYDLLKSLLPASEFDLVPTPGSLEIFVSEVAES